MCKRILICFFIFFCFFPAAILRGQEAPGKRVLTMGRATENVVKQQKKIQPIVEYLASRLKDMGIERGEVVLAGDKKLSTLRKLVKEGRIDIILESPFKATTLKLENIAAPLVTLSRMGSTEYNSLIFVRKDSEISRPEDLKGRVIAFEDPASTSAYFLPKVILKAKGLDLVEIPSFDAPVPKGKVGYVFAGSEMNQSSWVFYKKVDAGAFSNLDWETPEHTPESYKKDLKVIHESEKITEFIVLVREGLDKRLVDRIKEELLNMDKSDEGREALKAYEFDRFIDSPNRIRELFGYIENLMKLSGVEVD